MIDTAAAAAELEKTAVAGGKEGGEKKKIKKKKKYIMYYWNLQLCSFAIFVCRTLLINLTHCRYDSGRPKY